MEEHQHQGTSAFDFSGPEINGVIKSLKYQYAKPALATKSILRFNRICPLSQGPTPTDFFFGTVHDSRITHHGLFQETVSLLNLSAIIWFVSQAQVRARLIKIFRKYQYVKPAPPLECLEIKDKS